jgi:hypothetical protein
VNGTNIPQVVYQLELISEKIGGGSDRKGILGDFMNAIIKKLLSAPPTDWPTYIKTAMEQGQSKHVLIYTHDPKSQAMSEEWNYAGRIKSVDPQEDYLHINDSNLAGLKSNLYLTQTTSQDITVDQDGSVREKLTITYENTGKQDGWLNARARNYVRVYVPKGSKLIKATGGSQKVSTTTELDKTVFDNFVQVNPLQKATVTFEYSLPFKISGAYKELIQKQPGAKNWNYSVSVNGKSQQVLLNSDRQVSF